MKLKILLPLSASLALAAAPPNVATANVTATLLQPLSLSLTHDLEFGDIILVDGTSGSAKVSPTSAPTYSGGLAPGNTHPAAPLQAQFTSTGSVAYGITFSTSIQMTDKAGVGAPINVASLTVDQSGTTLTADAVSGVFSGTTDKTGTTALKVGATMSVPAGQVAGSYAGTFQVTVNYQ